MSIGRWLCVGVLGFASSSYAVQAGGTAGSPAKRPNVIFILADDMGFSDVGCYGGEIKTPHIDGMAKEGTRFTQFYNMARCCPTRATLMTGVYPHQAGVGDMNQDRGIPPYQGELNDKCITIAENLKQAGYHTGMVGKWHLVHTTIASVPGPKQKAMLAFEDDTPISPSKANWPCNRGFEDHWGTIPGVESYWDPYGLVHNETTIKNESTRAGRPFYYTDFITDHAVKMIGDYAKESTAGDKPFYMYVAYTAPHWPMQAPEDEIAKYAETYKVGWDEIRKARFARQVQMGLVDEKWGISPRAFNKGLNDRDSVVGPWEEITTKDWQARRMAVYAAMISVLDDGVGKIMAQLKASGVDDNTLVFFMSDNGACQENVQPGWYDIPRRTRDGREIAVGDNADAMPGPETVYQSYGPAWANASNTPFRKFKHFTEEGGISAPFIARWPGKIPEDRIEKKTVGHIIDLFPTILAAAGASHPDSYKDKPVLPLEGQSLLPTLEEGKPLEHRGLLFWEHENNRAVRDGDFKLVAPNGEGWKLFNLAEDRTELHDLSAEMPEKVKELKEAFEAWGKRVGAYPKPR